MGDKMREEFESWIKTEFDGCMPRRKGRGYLSLYVDGSWKAWQASRAALCVELPSFENGSLRGYNGDCNEANMVIDCIAESLDEAGVSHK